MAGEDFVLLVVQKAIADFLEVVDVKAGVGRRARCTLALVGGNFCPFHSFLSSAICSLTSCR